MNSKNYIDWINERRSKIIENSSMKATYSYKNKDVVVTSDQDGNININFYSDGHLIKECKFPEDIKIKIDFIIKSYLHEFSRFEILNRLAYDIGK